MALGDTKSIVPRGDQQGTLGTAAKSWGQLFIENPNDGDAASVTISNLDTNQIALDINASNIDANIIDINAQTLQDGNGIYIDANSLTTGSAINIDVDDASFANTTKSLISIDYDNSGVTAAGRTNATTGLNISMDDAATNDASGIVTTKGVVVSIDAASDQGTITQRGFEATLTDGDVANTIGYYSNVEDGGIDFKAVSSANTGNYFTISTTAFGATTLKTIDDTTAKATFEIEADGNITLDPVNATTGVIIDGTAGTTANALSIDCDALTTGAALNIDVDDALTTSATKSLMKIDYDKSGVTGSSQSSITTGLDISMVDAATNNASGTVNNTGINVAIDAASNQGTINQTGVAVSLTDADIGLGGNSIGFQSTVEDASGSTFDFKAISSNDANDYFALAVGASGESYIKTVDGGAAAAHLNIQVDGIIKHTGTGGESRWYNTALNTGDYMSLVVGANGDATLTTVDAAATAAHFEVAADGNITLDAAANIALESGADSTNYTTIKNRKISVTSSTDGDYDGDVVYFGGTTSMTTGAIYHYKSDGTWELADADDNTKSDGLLGVALGAASDTNGVLLRGMVTIDHDPGAIGDVLYLTTTAGDCSATAPSGNGNIVRIIGYQVSHASNGNIWFNPDNTFVEVSA